MSNPTDNTTRPLNILNDNDGDILAVVEGGGTGKTIVGATPITVVETDDDITVGLNQAALNTTLDDRYAPKSIGTIVGQLETDMTDVQDELTTAQTDISDNQTAIDEIERNYADGRVVNTFTAVTNFDADINLRGNPRKAVFNSVGEVNAAYELRFNSTHSDLILNSAGTNKVVNVRVPLDMSNRATTPTFNKIINVADPTSAQDVATKNYVDNLTPVSPVTDITAQAPINVTKTGTVYDLTFNSNSFVGTANAQTVTGAKTFSNNLTLDADLVFTGARKISSNDNLEIDLASGKQLKLYKIPNPTYSDQAANKAYADTKVGKSGNETVDGDKVFSNKVSIMQTPTAGTDAANKDYVDNNGGRVNNITAGKFLTANYTASSKTYALSVDDTAFTNYMDGKYLSLVDTTQQTLLSSIYMGEPVTTGIGKVMSLSFNQLGFIDTAGDTDTTVDGGKLQVRWNSVNDRITIDKTGISQWDGSGAIWSITPDGTFNGVKTATLPSQGVNKGQMDAAITNAVPAGKYALLNGDDQDFIGKVGFKNAEENWAVGFTPTDKTLVSKKWVLDNTSGGGGDVTAAGNNAFTGNNSFAQQIIINEAATLAQNPIRKREYDREVVKLTGNQEVTGTKTFSALKLGAVMDANEFKITNLDSPVASTDAVNKVYADGSFVALLGNQTIAGDKEFTGTVSVVNPVNGTDAANRQFVENNFAQYSTDNTWGGLNTFNKDTTFAKPVYSNSSVANGKFILETGTAAGFIEFKHSSTNTRFAIIGRSSSSNQHLTIGTFNNKNIILSSAGGISANKPIAGQTPTADDHLATKKYVDDNSGGGTTNITLGTEFDTGIRLGADNKVVWERWIQVGDPYASTVTQIAASGDLIGSGINQFLGITMGVIRRNSGITTQYQLHNINAVTNAPDQHASIVYQDGTKISYWFNPNMTLTHFKNCPFFVSIRYTKA